MTRILAAMSLVLAGVAMLACPTGTLAAPHSDRRCSNCHVPHQAAPETDPAASWGVPLWSTEQTADGLPTFTLYSSAKFDALGTDIGQPDGSSKLCLGCHDGSYDWVSTETMFTAETGLALSHPISFTYDTTLASNVPNGGLRDPATASAGLGGTATIQTALLDKYSKMQCTSCHDVHASGIGESMLRWDISTSTGAATMCKVCHNK